MTYEQALFIIRTYRLPLEADKMLEYQMAFRIVVANMFRRAF